MMKDAKNLASIGENLTPTFADPFRTSDQAISLYSFLHRTMSYVPTVSRAISENVITGVLRG